MTLFVRLQQGAAVRAWIDDYSMAWPLWHKRDSLQAELVEACCSQAAAPGRRQQGLHQHVFGVQWLLQQSEEQSTSSAAPPKVKPDFSAMQKGLLQPDAILQLAHQQQSLYLHTVNTYLKALARHGKQPEIHSHPGYAKLMDSISTADKAESEV